MKALEEISSHDKDAFMEKVILERLDRFMMNIKMDLLSSSFEVLHVDFIAFDHRPILA